MEKMNGMDELSESTDTGDNERDAATSRKFRHRKKGLSLIPEDFHQLGLYNQGYQNETTEPEIRKVKDDESVEPCCEVDVHFEMQIPSLTKARKSRKVSFYDQKQHEYETSDEEKDSTDVVCSPATNAFKIEVATLPERERKLSFVKKERGSENTGTEEDSTEITCKPEKRRPMTTRGWLMNPHVYKVCCPNGNVFFFSFLLVYFNVKLN